MGRKGDDRLIVAGPLGGPLSGGSSLGAGAAASVRGRGQQLGGRFNRRPAGGPHTRLTRAMPDCAPAPGPGPAAMAQLCSIRLTHATPGRPTHSECSFPSQLQWAPPRWQHCSRSLRPRLHRAYRAALTPVPAGVPSLLVQKWNALKPRLREAALAPFRNATLRLSLKVGGMGWGGIRALRGHGSRGGRVAQGPTDPAAGPYGVGW